MMNIFLFAAALLVGSTMAASAEPVPPFSAPPATLPVLTVPHATLTPQMEAAPDDPAWRSAGEIDALTSSLIPGKALPAVPPTRVLALWDKEFLYVRYVATDNEVFTPHSERDALQFQGDVAEFFFDAVGDGRQYFEFQLSARGGVLDQNITITTAPRTDEYGCLLNDIRLRDYWANLSWDCEGLRTAARVLRENGHETGWIAEYAFPAQALLQRLGQTSFAPGTLRANFLRYDWPKDPVTGVRNLVAENWSPVLFGSPHKSAARMGFLKLVAGK